MYRSITLITGFILFSIAASAQDTLPKFSVKDAGKNRYIIGWVNNYPLVKQIGIQRSHDSLANFKTILSVTDPNAQTNGFVDSKAPNDHMFYRIYIMLDKGIFFFSDARKPVLDTFKRTKFTDNVRINGNDTVNIWSLGAFVST